MNNFSKNLKMLKTAHCTRLTTGEKVKMQKNLFVWMSLLSNRSPFCTEEICQTLKTVETFRFLFWKTRTIFLLNRRMTLREFLNWTIRDIFLATSIKTWKNALKSMASDSRTHTVFESFLAPASFSKKMQLCKKMLKTKIRISTSWFEISRVISNYQRHKISKHHDSDRDRGIVFTLQPSLKFVSTIWNPWQ